MSKKPTLSIAIPAYNEEKSILKLLTALMNQIAKSYRLDGIFVYSDGSTDNTVKLIRDSFKSVTVHDFKKNLGKNKRVNQIMKDNKSDILVQIDADITLGSNKVLDELVKKMVVDPKVGIACSYHKALSPNSFVGKLAMFGFNVWDECRSLLGKRGVRYYCEGGSRAFSRSFTKEFRLPLGKHIGEDSYSFYYAVEHGYKVSVAKRSIVYLQLPESARDYIRQMKRFLNEPSMVEANFRKDLVKQYETINPVVKFRAFLKVFAKSPFVGLGYIVLQLITKLLAKNYEPDEKWAPIERK